MNTRSYSLNLLAALVIFIQLAGSAWAQVAVDLELVLAVDVSMSLAPAQPRLQPDADIASLRDPIVISAIRSGQRGRIAVTYIEWAGPHHQAVLVPWRLIDGPASIEAFIADLSSKPYSRHTMTSISSA